MEVGNTQDVSVATETQAAATTQENSTPVGETQASAGGEFSEMMLKVLGMSEADSVNEEELFAGLIEQRLSGIDENAASAYREAKDRFMSEMARADGYVPVEDAANRALESLVSDGIIDSETAAKVKSESFRAAQLDDNLGALYDGRGLAGDETIAVASMDEALAKIQAAIQGIESGEISTETETVDETAVSELPISGAQELDGEGGFLWKPESESDGNLVVLLPTELRQMIERVEIHSALPTTEDTLLGTGRFTGDDHNGERLHYRFDEPGSAFGENIHLVAYGTDGTEISWNIANGGERQD